MATPNKLKIFLDESRQELKKVNWPTKEETLKYTVFVIITSIALSLFLGFWDAIFIKMVQFIIS